MKIYNNIDELKKGLKSNFKPESTHELKNNKGYYNKNNKKANISNKLDVIDNSNLRENMASLDHCQENDNNKICSSFCNTQRLEELENYDKLKTRVLKYVVYKKRTENEIYQKFSREIEPKTLDKIINELKENGYINDIDYVCRAVNEFTALRNLSLWEIKYKLISKGIKSNLIDDYFSNHDDELKEYEKQSAKNIAIKKNHIEKIEIKKYLIKKGYKEESIRYALED